ncbi:MAG: ComF family protein [Acidimicrobiales bacterium]
MLTTSRCPICRRSGGSPCRECVELFAPLGRLRPPPGLDGLHAAVSYEDAARPLITSLKYRDQRAATGWLADAMVAVLPASARPEVVTWAPTTAARRRERGFDQAELLARAVARRLRVPARRLLRRHAGPSQTGRSASERHRDVAAFVGVRRRPGNVVVLVDDVVTTGATLSAAATPLRRAGAARVIGLVAAATPAPGSTGGSVPSDDR